MAEKPDNSTPRHSSDPEMEYCVKPAHEWLEEVELSISSLSARREELRCRINIETRERQRLNPTGEPVLRAYGAMTVARSEVLGPDWVQLQERVRHARQRINSMRRQLRGLEVQAHARHEGVGWWGYRLWQRVDRSLKARSLRRRLNRANAQRRAGLVRIRDSRSDLSLPEIRFRVIALSEKCLLKEERLSQSIQSLKEVEQTVSDALSEALRLAPRLRDLGTEIVPMRRHKKAELRLSMPPVPARPLCAATNAPKNGRGIRAH